MSPIPSLTLPASTPPPGLHTLLLVSMGSAYKYIRSLVYLFSSLHPHMDGHQVPGHKSPEGGLTHGPKDRPRTSSPQGRTCCETEKAFPAQGRCFQNRCCWKNVTGNTDARSGWSGWAGLGVVGEEAGGLAEGMQISIMNYASA